MIFRRRDSWSGEVDSTASAWVVRRDAGLSAEQQAELERWRTADPRHAEALAWHEKAWSTLDRPRSTGQSNYLLREYRARAVRRRRRRLSLAATAGLCLALGLLVREWRPTELVPSSASETFVVVRPEQQELPDGTLVDLRSDTAIAVDFNKNLRRITLQQGEAHFQVAKNPERPFVVEAGGVEVRAIGTAFSVQLLSDQVEVLVTEGQVEVDQGRASGATLSTDESGPDGLQERSALVGAGYRVVVSGSQAARIAPPQVHFLPPAEFSERLAWRSTQLEFSDTPLEEAVALLNRYSGPTAARLVIGDDALSTLPINGFFRADHVELLVHLLEASAGIAVERAGSTMILRRAPEGLPSN